MGLSFSYYENIKRQFGVKVRKLKGEEAMGCLLAIIFGIIYLPIGILSELTKNYK